ncbi:MAG: hypothetical protein BMS9Abin37_1210 [Acidobacteriota bacterium]|nr:MAG: hypothetical protein BMS9Abin37_1210 [Acidobacteriota bacterium]
MTIALLLAALALAGTPPQDNLDSRWVPWLGCWELVDDQRREPLIGEADPTKGQDVPLRGLVCLNPAPDGNGVTVTTAAGGEAFLEETLVADGEKNPSAKGKCTGWQRTEWSADGYRLFTSAELTCEENRKLSVSGLSMMVPRSTWVDIQIVESSAGRAVVIRRYRPANDTQVIDAGVPVLDTDLEMKSFRRRLALTKPLSADDIAEAASKVAPEALEAAVLEHEQGFALDAAGLMRLDDAGVRPGLIDLMVALSYPDQFVVSAGSGDAAGGGGFALPGTFYGPSYGTGYYGTGYSGLPYSYRTPYHVAPFGYYYWYAPQDSRYVVRPIAVPEVRQGLVSNRGYAQVAPRHTGRRARARGGSGGNGQVSGSGHSSGSVGSVSSQGYSHGGSSGRGGARRK